MSYSCRTVKIERKGVCAPVEKELGFSKNHFEHVEGEE
jgi:hypothetical protein